MRFATRRAFAAGRCVCALSASILVTHAALAGEQATDVLTPERAVDLKRVSDARLDPGGTRIAYVLSVPRGADDEPGGSYAELWVVGVDGSDARRFTRAKSRVSAPRWSPDGRHIAFLAERETEHEQTQIYLMPVDGGEPRLLTESETSVSTFAWSPDGKWIAFTAADPPTEAEEEDEEAGRDWFVADENFKHVRLFVLDVETRETHAAYEDELSTSSVVWTPDSGTLIFQAADTPRVDGAMMYSRIYRVARSGGSPAVVCKTQGKLGGMSVSPDGTRLAFLGATDLHDPLPQSVFVVPLPTGEPLNLTQGGAESFLQADWIDNDTLIALANRGPRSILVRLGTREPERATIAEPAPVVFRFDLHRRTGSFVALASDPHFPTEAFVGTVTGDKLHRISNHNPGLSALRLGKRAVVEWVIDDGPKLSGVLTYPVDYEPGRACPTIINPHGGPEGVSVNGWSTLAQLLAARGFLVLQPNYRGSGGHGVAYSKGDHNDLGGKEFQDILDGLAMLVDRGLADPQRVGIGGWSYGGYLSALAATHHSHVFKAAVMGAGISNWYSFAGTTDIPHEMSLVHWNQWAYDDPALYWQRSPLARLDQANTPTLILHGADDARVDPGQAWEMYTALKQKGVPTQLVLYPRSGHGIGERAHRIDLYERQLAWFERYVK